MPTHPGGGLFSVAQKSPGTSSHLAETGHTLETHSVGGLHAVPERETAALDAREPSRDGEALGGRGEVEAEEEASAFIEETTQAEAKVGSLPAMALTRYLLNLATGVLHDTQHMSERCNTDQIERSDRKRASSEANLMSEPRYKRLCRWCHPKVVANPEPPEGSDDDDTA